MFKRVMCSIVLLLMVIGFVTADEFDAAITDASPVFTKRADGTTCFTLADGYYYVEVASEKELP
jgi:hypothetical protein